MIVTTVTIALCFLSFCLGTVIASDCGSEPVVVYNMNQLDEMNRKKIEKEEPIDTVPSKSPTVSYEYESPYYEEIPLDSDVQAFLRMVCKEYRVNMGIALAFMESESSFKADAEGDSGRSIGYMQINKPNWDRYGLDASIPYDNIEIGVRMLSELIAKYGDLDAVTMAYKGGEAKADRWIQEGFRLSVCDKIIERVQYWQSVIGE